MRTGYPIIERNNLLKSNKEIFKGFTLTEVLLAIAIVGIIAALVMPMVIKNFQEKTLKAGYEREKQTIEASVASLLVNENVDTYTKTMLYTSEEAPASYADTSGKYIKKYLKVSKYCGDNNGDCFADKYYEYTDGDKKDYTPTYKGACASLKNGSSVCIEPRTSATIVMNVLMDVNGKKGPNVKGRDLREFSIALPNAGSLDRTSQAVDWNHKLIEVPPQCADGVITEACCDIALTDACCDAFPEKYGSRSECKTCSATKGNDAECCTTSSEYKNAHKASCCANIFKAQGKVKFKSEGCCAPGVMPTDPLCIETPPQDEIITISLTVGRYVTLGNCWGYSSNQATHNIRYEIALHAVSNAAATSGIYASGTYCPYSHMHSCSSGLSTLSVIANSYATSLHAEKNYQCNNGPNTFQDYSALNNIDIYIKGNKVKSYQSYELESGNGTSNGWNLTFKYNVTQGRIVN